MHASAYYYVAFQMVGLLFAGVFAVEQAFLSEGSHAEVELRSVMRRSWHLLVLFCVPATVVLALAARWLLLLLGDNYSVHGTDALIVLATSALPFGAFNWLMTVLRLIGRLSFIVVGNVVEAFAAYMCTGLGAGPRGLVVLSPCVAGWTHRRSSSRGRARVAVGQGAARPPGRGGGGLSGGPTVRPPR